MSARSRRRSIAASRRTPTRSRAVSRPLLQRGLAADPAKRWPAIDPLLAAFDRAVRRPKAIKQWSQAIGLGVFAFVAIFVVMNFAGGHKSTPSCDGASALRTVYNKQQIATLLADRKAAEQLDRWARSWVEAYDGNCKKPDDDDFSARTLCLEGERDQARCSSIRRACTRSPAPTSR